MSRNTFFRVHNDASQAERRALLKSERAGTTYRQFAETASDAVGGRYAAEAKSRVIGTEPVRYPTLPPSSPWANDFVGPEPPTGVAIDQMMEPVGTHAEIEQSIMREVRDGGVAPTTPLPELSHSGDARRADMGPLQPRVRRFARRRRNHTGAP